MTVFGEYAQFYDILYGDKDYEAECDFLEEIFRRYAQGPMQTVLDLGCGTGGHVFPLMRRGYRVTGIDRSQDMLAIAQGKVTDRSPVPVFRQGDIRDVDLEQKFDAVIAMFAVMSYMTSNEDLLAALRTARRHLRPGGLFAFDAWFGPAVLTQKPTDRCKIIDRDGERIVRFVHPELRILDHVVEVNYHVLRLREKQVADETSETHSMRFLFPQEIGHYLDESGFRLRNLSPFLRPDDQLTDQDWNMAVVAEAR
jgi:SAM-dependent methyltransferase